MQQYVILTGPSLLNFNLIGPFSSRNKCVKWLKEQGYKKDEDFQKFKKDWQGWSSNSRNHALIRELHGPVFSAC